MERKELKVLVTYNDETYLIPVKHKGSIDYDYLFSVVNRGRWPDECHDKDWIISRSKVIAYFTDESELIN